MVEERRVRLGGLIPVLRLRGTLLVESCAVVVGLCVFVGALAQLRPQRVGRPRPCDHVDVAVLRNSGSFDPCYQVDMEPSGH